MYFVFRDETSVEPFKEEILKVEAFARLVRTQHYGWPAFKALDDCYGYKTMFAHLPLDIRQAKIIRARFGNKVFGGWDTPVMKEAIAEYIDGQYDVEYEAYQNNEMKIAATNRYIASLELKPDGYMEINTEDTEVVDASSIMEKLKVAYSLQEQQFKMRKMLRDSLLGKLSDKGSKVRGDKETTWLERKNNEERLKRKGAKQGSEQIEPMPTES